ERSRESRELYLSRLDDAIGKAANRAVLSCGNLAHGFAACAPGEKAMLAGDRVPNLGIITSYNDMLSAHQPFETFPALIKQAARGGPAMSAGATRECRAWGGRCSRPTCSRGRPPWGSATTCSTPPSISASATRSCRGC